MPDRTRLRGDGYQCALKTGLQFRSQRVLYRTCQIPLHLNAAQAFVWQLLAFQATGESILQARCLQSQSLLGELRRRFNTCCHLQFEAQLEATLEIALQRLKH